MRAMFIGAHPDDVEYACGGTITRLISKGCEIKIVVLTHGRDDRKEECLNACSVLGVNEQDVVFYDEPDGHIHSDEKLVSLIENQIYGFHPDIVVTHAPKDTHQDHRNVSAAVTSACRKGLPIAYFDSYSSCFFFPNIFVTLEKENEEKKENALMEHKSQRNKKNAYDILISSRTKSMYFGMISGTEYAEAFRLERVIL